MSPDVIALNQNLSPRQLKTARVKDKKTPPDYERMLYEQCGAVGREGHHVTYRRMGAWNEFLDVRYLCHECHKAQHPNKGDWTNG